MQNYSSREKYLISNTLNCLSTILQGKGVVIDLRNETTVAGIIDVVDGHMTCELKQAVFINRNNQLMQFDNFVVRNRMIRLLHVPADLDLKQGLSLLQRRRMSKTNTKRSLKQKRVETRHRETLESISKQKQTK
ncbi:Lsm10 [Drosophila busckii]|uniref:Lsm10 n=2 Tax=Drosophila busckii TaxID=30019 RepID=A0A0M4ETR1_DROBS|nr:Lsm10 [Drosophila busckii]